MATSVSVVPDGHIRFISSSFLRMVKGHSLSAIFEPTQNGSRRRHSPSSHRACPTVLLQHRKGYKPIGQFQCSFRTCGWHGFCIENHVSPPTLLPPILVDTHPFWLIQIVMRRSLRSQQELVQFRRVLCKGHQCDHQSVIIILVWLHHQRIGSGSWPRLLAWSQ